MHDIDTAPFNYFVTVNSCSDNLTVKYRRILKTTDGKDTYPMAANKKWHTWEVVIPADVSCTHCILQVCFYSNMASLIQSHFTSYSKLKFSNQSISTRSIGKLEIKDAVLIWLIVPAKIKSILLPAQTSA